METFVATDQFVTECKSRISPLFFNQKIEQKLPLKKMPSTAAKATRRSAKFPPSIQRSAHPLFS
jgi:hypothetical protein